MECTSSKKPCTVEITRKEHIEQDLSSGPGDREIRLREGQRVPGALYPRRS